MIIWVDDADIFFKDYTSRIEFLW